MKLLILSCTLLALSRAADASPVAKETEAKAVAGIPEMVLKTGNCPVGWPMYKGRCYRFIPTAMSWAKAERNCLSMNANLASVHSVEEYHHIQNLIRYSTHGYPESWIGGSDAQEERIWLWSDGSPFHYTKWCRGEPNNKWSQHCLLINDTDEKCWDDLQCDKQRPSVCAKDM